MEGVCIPNIGRRERRNRMTFGLVVVGAGAAALVALLIAGAAPLWRLPLFLVFWLGLIGVLQAREKT